MLTKRILQFAQGAQQVLRMYWTLLATKYHIFGKTSFFLFLFSVHLPNITSE